jgi:hypothetical protein
MLLLFACIICANLDLLVQHVRNPILPKQPKTMLPFPAPLFSNSLVRHLQAQTVQCLEFSSFAPFDCLYDDDELVYPVQMHCKPGYQVAETAETERPDRAMPSGHDYEAQASALREPDPCTPGTPEISSMSTKDHNSVNDIALFRAPPLATGHSSFSMCNGSCVVLPCRTCPVLGGGGLILIPIFLAYVRAILGFAAYVHVLQRSALFSPCAGFLQDLHTNHEHQVLHLGLPCG